MTKSILLKKPYLLNTATATEQEQDGLLLHQRSTYYPTKLSHTLFNISRYLLI